jgi:hypothetical protein
MRRARPEWGCCPAREKKKHNANIYFRIIVEIDEKYLKRFQHTKTGRV